MTSHAWVRRWASPGCLSLLLFLGACGEKTPPEPRSATPTAPPPSAAAPPPAEPTPAAGPPGADAPAEAAAAIPTEDWIVWSQTATGWSSAWLAVRGDEVEVLAARAAPVLSSGERLWRLERRDATVDVSTCACVEDDEEAGECVVHERLTVPGLVAIELGTGVETPVRVGEAEVLIGEDLSASLELHGGAGAKLFFSWTLGGYMCGAHGAYDGRFHVRDLGADADVEGLERLDQALPRSLLERAGAEVRAALAGCEGGDEEVSLARAIEEMSFNGLHVGLGVGGEVSLRWRFGAGVVYACSADYTVTGDGITGLIPEAAPVGITGPLSEGVRRALADLGAAPTLGFSRVTLEGDARAVMLEVFRSAPEPVWGPSHYTSQTVPRQGPKRTAAAREKTAEGREATRFGRLADAVAAFREAVALDPALAPAYSGLGYALLMTGELDEARVALEQALRRDETPAFRAQVLYNLGRVAEARGDTAAAREAYQRSLALRPHDVVQKALQSL